ncbi:MAG: hypothetical protein JO253_04785 [Alphaproteobacteria bacterium]|nr:hypothetical protein [Alphaproteobacteria bacterium]
MKYFVIGPFKNGLFYIAYKYQFCEVFVPIQEFSSERVAQRECALLNHEDDHSEEENPGHPFPKAVR